MKIELWYDAVAQETDILINGIPVEKNDVYGFLYPVRHYPIQSWIYPNGSWKGIEPQIMDLARDESVELVFHGRKCDYDDLSKCLCENSRIRLTFVQWDVCSRYDDLFSNLLSTLQSNDSLIQQLRTMLHLPVENAVTFDLTVDASDWAYHIYNDDDLAKAVEVPAKCCYIHSSFFDDYDKLQSLLSLTRSLKIPADGIYCCFDDVQTKEDYAYYAQSFKKMSFHFCLEDADYAEEAKAKYGLPAIVKAKIEQCAALTQTLSANYLKLKDSTQVEFNGLKKRIVTLNQEETERYQTIKLLRDHADRFRHGMELIGKYIHILLSVSKDNKEEVFHYQCIDKLDANISLYLNAKSFNGVNENG